MISDYLQKTENYHNQTDYDQLFTNIDDSIQHIDAKNPHPQNKQNTNAAENNF